MPKVKIYPFRLNENFLNGSKNDEEKLNSEIFREYFRYQNPPFLAKDLLKANQVKKSNSNLSYSFN